MKGRLGTTLFVLFLALLFRINPCRGNESLEALLISPTEYQGDVRWRLKDDIQADKALQSNKFQRVKKRQVQDSPLNFNLTNVLLSILPQSFLQPATKAFSITRESTRMLTTCSGCRIGMSVIMQYLRSQSRPYNFLELLKLSCSILPLKTEVCEGMLREYGRTLVYIVTTKRDLPADRLCGMFLQSFGCDTRDPLVHWDVLQELGYSEKEVNEVKRETPESAPDKQNIGSTWKILQLTDIHLDPFYKPGSDTKCELETCCRGPEIFGRNRGGYYGDYRNCDIPYHTLELAMAHIAETHPDINIIYLNGDLIAHVGIGWKSSREEVEYVMANVTGTIKRFFPNTPVVPILGNHDTHPVNLISPPGASKEFSHEWVFTSAAKLWAKWLPPNAMESFLKGGHYSFEVNPRFRILAISNNYCFTFNFWQLFEDRDPFGQLRWLATELKKAEEANQKVHIVGHIPPSWEACWVEWSENYYKIVSRFRATITGQFFGHTHYDNFGLYYDPKQRDLPISSFWVGASLSPFSNLNPGYKIYTVDGAREAESTYQVLEHEAWIFNLTEANRHPKTPPRWYRLYKATEAYGLPDLSPSSLHKHVKRMSEDPETFKNFFRHMYKESDVEERQGCDAECRKSILCSIVSPSFKLYSVCMVLEDTGSNEVLSPLMFDSNLASQSLTGLRVTGPWTKRTFISREGL